MFLFVFGLVAITTVALAQTQVTGKVTDDKGNPIIKATITEKGTKNAVPTDENGNFKITVKSTFATLVITSIGFERIETKLQNIDKIILKRNNEGLDEVVVTGYTYEKKSKYSGATSRVTAKAFEDVPNGSFAQSLQGRSAGVLVNSGSGQPGSTPRVQIRGISSISGAFTQPLYIIDGVPYSENDFKALNSNDFEDVTFLKDAEAVSLYGSRGAGGVIVITTKRGKSGDLKITFRTQYGTTEKPDFSRLNSMSSSELLDFEKKYKIGGAPGYIWSDSFPGYSNRTQTQKDSLSNLLNGFRNNNIDFTNLFYRTGISKNNEIQLSGGNDKTRFYSSIGYFDQEGIDIASYLKRYSLRLNLDHVEKNIILNFNNLISYTDQGLADGEYRGNSALNPFQLTYRALPYQNPFKPDGSLNYGSSTPTNPTVVANSLEAIRNTTQYFRQLKINSGFSFTYKILPELFIKNTAGVDYSSVTFLRFINPNSYRGSLEFANNGIDQEGQFNNSQIINTTNLSFNKTYNEVHSISANVFYELIKGYNKAFGFTLYNLDKRLLETGNGANNLPFPTGTTYPQRASSAKSQFGIRSYFAMLKYTYNDKYTISANFRRDGTSRILKDENKEITSSS
ncbi:MAG: SusC/RagA family TonB-linked outer membrane protein, partial [Sediminibacterium sp.]|nr:SusC/RagA family TonB-linked outer membrane protein [Sediminibacterium sp.]